MQGYKIKDQARLTRGKDISSSEFIALSSFLEMGKLGGRKYRKQFLRKKVGTETQNGMERELLLVLSRKTKRNIPENLDQQVNCLMVGVWGGGIRLNADTVRGGGLCHGYSLLGHFGLLFLPTLLLCVRALILWRGWFHQPHIFTAFLHPMGNTELILYLSQTLRISY